MTMLAASICSPEHHAGQSSVSATNNNHGRASLIGTWLVKDCGSKLTTRPFTPALIAKARAWFLLEKEQHCTACKTLSVQRRLLCERHFSVPYVTAYVHNDTAASMRSVR